MGLDMYLSAKRYFGSADWRPEEKAINEAMRSLPLLAPMMPPKCGNQDYIELEVEVGYWRKANQIHNWFVENVQGGEDKCRPHYVSIDQLRELRDLCRKVLGTSELEPAEIVNGYTVALDGDTVVKTPIVEPGQRIVDPIPASELLPTASGFFFGGTEYDEYYFEDVKATDALLTKLIAWHDSSKDNQQWDFYYRSSW